MWPLCNQGWRLTTGIWTQLWSFNHSYFFTYTAIQAIDLLTILFIPFALLWFIKVTHLHVGILTILQNTIDLQQEVTHALLILGVQRKKRTKLKRKELNTFK